MQGQWALDLKYNKYLQIKLMQRLAKQQQTKQIKRLEMQSAQIVGKLNELVTLKHKLEMEKATHEINSKLCNVINKSSALIDSINLILENHSTFNKLHDKLEASASKVPVKNIDLTDCNDEQFMKLMMDITTTLDTLVGLFKETNSSKMYEMLKRNENDAIMVEKILKECENYYKDASVQWFHSVSAQFLANNDLDLSENVGFSTPIIRVLEYD